MMATDGPKYVRCSMYFYIKQITLDGTIIYLNIIQNYYHLKVLKNFH
jgi:hypothetical protein